MSENGHGVKFWPGNIVVAEAAVAAGCNFFAGYPITPSSEIAHQMSLLLPRGGGHFVQMEDELGAMGAVIGASLAGAKALTATSGPGMSLKLENLGFGYMVEAPCVVVNVMRGGPSTGLPTHPSQSDLMQARWGTHGDHPTIALAPAFHQEIFLETIRAFNLAEQFRMPVILLIDEVLGHLSEGVVPPERDAYEIVERAHDSGEPDKFLPYDVTAGDIPPFRPYFDGATWHTTGLNHDETGFPTTDAKHIQQDMYRHYRKVLGNRDVIDKVEYYMADDAEIGIVSFGSTARAAMAAVKQAREQGVKVGLLRPVTVWPFPKDQVYEFGRDKKYLIVPEFNLGQMVYEVERAVHFDRPIKRVNKVGGVPIYPSEILAAIEEVA
ncbi:MAG: 2-oxoglutarate oxidoreductase subunit KorA [Calditrichaeota bacterium]|nr:2-oxoglutarate oxidoreductase subunit KorA [Calditrichota bacterium]